MARTKILGGSAVLCRDFYVCSEPMSVDETYVIVCVLLPTSVISEVILFCFLFHSPRAFSDIVPFHLVRLAAF